VVGSCECGNELSGAIKCREFLGICSCFQTQLYEVLINIIKTVHQIKNILEFSVQWPCCRQQWIAVYTWVSVLL
jgi:hypothetical protein